MRFTWNDDAGSWQTAVASGTGREPGAGPVGPAGVSLVRVGDASVSVCTMTGRVTSARVPGRPDGREQALHQLFFGRAPDLGRRPGESFDDVARPVADRLPLARWAHRSDAVSHVDFGSNAVAELFARLEHAAAAGEVHSLGAGGIALVPLSDLVAALTAADEAVERVQDEEGGAWSLAHPLHEQGLGTGIRMLLAGLRPALVAAHDRAETAGRPSLGFVADLVSALSSPASPGSLGVLELERVDADPVAGPAAADPGTSELPIRVVATGGPLPRSAERELGLRGDLHVVVDGRWHELSADRAPVPERLERTWVLAIAADGAILGGGQMEGTGDRATVRLLVPDGARVESYRLDHNLARRPNPGVRWRSAGAADTASRAGWAAQQASGLGAANRAGAAKLIFAEAAIAWLHLGSQFRAGWAWTLADREQAADHLARLGLADLAPVLAAVAGVADLPSADELLAPALWTVAMPTQALLPRLPSDPSPGDVAFLLPAR